MGYKIEIVEVDGVYFWRDSETGKVIFDTSREKVRVRAKALLAARGIRV